MSEGLTQRRRIVPTSTQNEYENESEEFRQKAAADAANASGTSRGNSPQGSQQQLVDGAHFTSSFVLTIMIIQRMTMDSQRPNGHLERSS